MKSVPEQKKAYRAATLVNYGPVKDLTQSGSSKNPAENNGASQRCGIQYPRPGNTGLGC